MLIGVGVAACLMAPLTCYRRLLHAGGAAARQLVDADDRARWACWRPRVPVQWLLPALGWRGLFWAVAALLALADGGDRVAGAGRRGRRAGAGRGAGPRAGAATASIVRHPTVRAHGAAGLLRLRRPDRRAVAVGRALADARRRLQAAEQAAQGLFVHQPGDAAGLLAPGALVMPRLVAPRHRTPMRLMAWGCRWRWLLLVVIVALGPSAGAWQLGAVVRGLHLRRRSASRRWARRFPRRWPGRALSAFNLVIFAGVFCMQWGIGLLIDALRGWRLAGSRRLPAGLCRLRPVLRWQPMRWFLRRGRAACR
ncbi:MAG: hypothetical protein MZW92_27845 [Comamonadaceae bacterium]|nr:hypothetical protein [Comamonadaceae bacterium]